MVIAIFLLMTVFLWWLFYLWNKEKKRADFNASEYVRVSGMYYDKHLENAELKQKIKELENKK